MEGKNTGKMMLRRPVSWKRYYDNRAAMHTLKRPRSKNVFRIQSVLDHDEMEQNVAMRPDERTVPTRRLSGQDAQDAWALTAGNPRPQGSWTGGDEGIATKPGDEGGGEDEKTYHGEGKRSTKWTDPVAFYSSELGGVLTDIGAMGVHVDDSLVQGGCGVYERMRVVDGYVYQMEERLERLMTSAAKTNIRLPKTWHREQLKRIILETVAAGKEWNAWVTVILSLGRGMANADPTSMVDLKSCKPGLYVLVAQEDKKAAESEEYLHGWKVKTSPVPCKSPFFATLKSTDRFQDAMVIMDARVDGYDSGIMIDSEGFVAGAPDSNVACVTHDGELVIPPTTQAVPTHTLLRMMQLASEAKVQGDLNVEKIVRRQVTVQEAKVCAEVMLIGSQYPVMPVTQWDNEPIGDGEAGIVSLQLRSLLLGDLYPWENSPFHVEVPYGILTGMSS